MSMMRSMRGEARVSETKSRMYQDSSGLLMIQKGVGRSKRGRVCQMMAVEIGAVLFTLG